METLLERVTRVLASHPAPAVPLDELQRLVRGSGVAVAEDALVRALLTGGDRLRLVDPWTGPWAALRDGGGAAGAPFGSGAQDEEWASGVGRRWVVARPAARSSAAERGPLGRMRGTLAHLGWTVDGGSPRDLARWCGLVLEGGRLRDRARTCAPAA